MENSKGHFLKIKSVLFLFILFQNTYAQTTYKDVAPIFIANCTSCHHDGGIQFPLTQYSEVKVWTYSLLTAIQSGRMPPWPADPTYRNYAHERVMSEADKILLVNWINDGMPAGDTTLAPTRPVYGKTQLTQTPDLIINVPKFTSTAVSEDHYYCLNVPSGITQDRYIRAFEFVPGNASIIHHAVITIDTTGSALDDLSGGCYSSQGQINIGDYAPGMGATVLPGVSPAKFGFRLKANSKFSFQIHVPEGSNGIMDSSQLRIYFYPLGEPGIREMYFETVLQNWSFMIPANSVITATQKYPNSPAGLTKPVSLYGTFPHSHTTCTAILNYAYKGADTIPLIRINNWDFHWQGQYTFKSLVKIPIGYRLFAAHQFDNTINNPHTPDHTIPVLPGTSTTDEMLFDSYLFTNYQPGDEFINIDSLLSKDPLLVNTSVNESKESSSSLQLFPNPATNELYITGIQLEKELLVELFDMNGRKHQCRISQSQSTIKIDLHELNDGMYFIKIYDQVFKFIKHN